MPTPKTLYEMLGVARDAKPHEIGLAYQRLSTTMEQESSIPDPRRAAGMRTAYETLSDPALRDEYDAMLEDEMASDAVRTRRMRTIALAATVVLAAGAAAYFLLRAPASDAQGDNALAARAIVEAVGSHVARLEGALVSGEVRDLGMAVDVGDGEMIAPCRDLAAGMSLAVKQDRFRAPAEVTRSNPDLDICTLGVKAARRGIEVRRGPPGSQEKLQAVLVGAGGQVEARPVSVTPTRDATGTLEVRAAATLPPGTPIFDAQGRLAAIVAGGPAPAGGPVAWDAAHIARARAAH